MGFSLILGGCFKKIFLKKMQNEWFKLSDITLQ